jgi:glucose/arabinose dehydrogenase
VLFGLLLVACLGVAACGGSSPSPPGSFATSIPSRSGASSASGSIGPPPVSATSGPSAGRTSPAAPPDLGAIHLSLARFASGLDQPVGIVAPPDGSGRLFVVEQTGRIRIVDGSGAVAREPFLDLSGAVSCCGEQGLLGLAFNPAYRTDGRFFVDYTDQRGDTVVAAYRRRDASHADPASALPVLRVDQPFANHNGGQLAFGPDGDLYVALGDGGSGGDPMNNGQSLGTLLGKILRLDVRATAAGGDRPYRIPADNPFASRSGARPEIWAYGLRNPWRFSFDRSTGDLYVGDVGQAREEEIDLLPAGQGGGNFGWRVMEGDACYGASSCDRAGLVPPIAVYRHGTGDCAVIGGFVYRGRANPALDGVYLMGDDCSGRIRALRASDARAAQASGRVLEPRLLLDTSLEISSFGEDAAGELLLADRSGGALYRLGRG